jgi:hypothetical protein
MNSQTKRCPAHDNGAGRLLPIDRFHSDRNAIDGRQSYCKDCLNSKRRDRYAKTGPYISDLYNSCRSRAEREGVKFSLNLEEFQKLLSSPCAYGGASRPEVRVGVDRKDPAGGYTRSNCVPSCPRHNRMKQDLFSFESMVSIVATYAEAKECGDQVKRQPRKFAGATPRRAKV